MPHKWCTWLAANVDVFCFFQLNPSDEGLQVRPGKRPFLDKTRLPSWGRKKRSASGYEGANAKKSDKDPGLKAPQKPRYLSGG